MNRIRVAQRGAMRRSRLGRLPLTVERDQIIDARAPKHGSCVEQGKTAGPGSHPTCKEHKW
jgi:hypothetical protein